MYEQRRKLMRNGLGTVTALETKCESNWEDTQQRIEAICASLHQVAQKCCEEMWVKVHVRYEEIKWELGESRSRRTPARRPILRVQCK